MSSQEAPEEFARVFSRSARAHKFARVVGIIGVLISAALLADRGEHVLSSLRLAQDRNLPSIYSSFCYLLSSLGLCLAVGRRTRWLSLVVAILLALAILALPGFPPFNGAIAFCLLGLALFFANQLNRSPINRLLVGLFGAAVFAIGVSAGIGHAFGVTAEKWSWPETLTLPGASLLTLLGAGIIALTFPKRARSDVPSQKWLSFPFVLAASFTLTLLLWRALLVDQSAKIERLVRLEVADMSATVSDELRHRLEPLQRFVERWDLLGRPDAARWDTTTKVIMDHHHYYFGIGWVDPAFKVRWHKAGTGERRLTGFDWTVPPRLRALLSREGGRNQMGVAAAVSLGHQNVLSVFLPINRQGTGGWLWALFDEDRLFEHIFRNELPSGYSATLEKGGETIFSNIRPRSEQLASLAQSTLIRVDGEDWTLRAWPTEAELAQYRSPLPHAVGALGLVISLLLSIALYLGQLSSMRAKQVEAAKAIEREFAERKRSEERLRRILEAAPDAMLILGSNREIRELNTEAEKMFVALRNDLIGKPVTQVGLHCLDDFAAGRNESFLREAECRRSNGSAFPAEIRASEIPTEGEILTVVAIRDITEHQKLAHELARSNTYLENFAYTVSHDLKEPLRMVSIYVRLLDTHYSAKLDEEAHEFMKFAVEGAQKMAKLIDGLLAFSRVGTAHLQFAPVDLSAVAASAMHNLSLTLEDSHADIKIDPLPVVEGAEAQLVQLFQNLIANAIKYRSEAAPVIRISAERKGATWCISVCDNGIGFDPDQAKHLFRIFHRLDNVGDRPGTGIGLAICKRIVERLGGDIWAESKPGKGSTFYFTLPSGKS